MGLYVNPGNAGFARIRKGIYVDKSLLIREVNASIDNTGNMICCSRPRRFGKSFAAKMLCAYYDKTCDSHALFADLAIAKDASYETHLNRYDVIYLDITRFIATTHDLRHIVSELQQKVISELREQFPGCIPEGQMVLADALFNVAEHTGNPFYIIIDEWDALFREEKNNTALQKDYVQLLRGLFKGGMATDLTIAGVYMTGILPIKKYGTESALTDFWEYTMVSPGALSPYLGFSEQEVQTLCETYSLDMNDMRQWYDGYYFESVGHIYSPNSVMSAVRSRSFDNYWTKTESYEALQNYISINMDGLRDAVIAMLGGQHVPVDTLSFQNDVTSFRNKSDVLTLLIHLGYLAYNKKQKTAYIPNLEVADSFRLAIANGNWQEISQALSDSNDLLLHTVAGHGDVVAQALDHIHETTSSVLQYNNENSLACALTIAYYTARSEYLIVREMPAGKGFADLAFIPRKDTTKPAMIMELKYDADADTAIRQIHEKRYAGALKGFAGDVLLVGINYDKASKKHSCIIEQA